MAVQTVSRVFFWHLAIRCLSFVWRIANWKVREKKNCCAILRRKIRQSLIQLFNTRPKSHCVILLISNYIIGELSKKKKIVKNNYCKWNKVIKSSEFDLISSGIDFKYIYYIFNTSNSKLTIGQPVTLDLKCLKFWLKLAIFQFDRKVCQKSFVTFSVFAIHTVFLPIYNAYVLRIPRQSVTSIPSSRINSHLKNRFNDRRFETFYYFELTKSNMKVDIV